MSKKFNFFKILLIALIPLMSASVFAFWGDSEPEGEVKGVEDSAKDIILNDDGLVFMVSSKAETVSGFFEEQSININKNDSVIPLEEAKIFSGSKIIVRRAKKITIIVDGGEIENYTLQKNTEDAILENNITLNDIDIVFPLRSALIRNDTQIEITRVNIEEKIVKKDIDYKTVTKNDDRLGWREKKTKQKGEKGIKEIKYEITYHNGKEISREIMESDIIKDPITEIIVRGTYIKLGKSHKGQGTWYSYTGTMSAASPWLPMGSFAKVTNKGNGKSVIVKINDRGPFGKGRIIDLDKVAFRKIAPLGSGVISVKVEEVLN